MATLGNCRDPRGDGDLEIVVRLTASRTHEERRRFTVAPRFFEYTLQHAL